MGLRAKLPGFEGASEWINGQVNKEELKGKPVLVHFWAVSCYMCKEGMPQLKEWPQKYGELYGLQVVGVHMPRSEKDTDVEAVKAVIAQYGLEYPVLVDNAHSVTDAFENEYVPAFYLFDGEHQLRFFGAGEKAIGMVEQRIHKVLGPKRA
ncbi:redoxin domain-containing protein [Paenibacillus turpanensis]|uniref:redoxin domain-containing protein n=1 Tax=Paenibacillus turpanensis TaxID=2689078 RepID=UPI00140C9904|nr:redoxin domain-containing protein [Paenibacillus turpanensis]